MNDQDCQSRIEYLQSYRHDLLQQRNGRDAAITTLDMQLNVVRCELQALYTAQRGRPKRLAGLAK